MTSAASNLVRNATKFGKSSDRVWIRGSMDSSVATIEVEDQCGGLVGGQEERIFDPYSQDHEDRSGLGLGLAIAKRAVEAIKGELSARNLPGEGCVFTVRLPVRAQPVSQA